MFAQHLESERAGSAGPQRGEGREGSEAGFFPGDASETPAPPPQEQRRSAVSEQDPQHCGHTEVRAGCCLSVLDISVLYL